MNLIRFVADPSSDMIRHEMFRFVLNRHVTLMITLCYAVLLIPFFASKVVSYKLCRIQCYGPHSLYADPVENLDADRIGATFLVNCIIKAEENFWKVILHYTNFRIYYRSYSYCQVAKIEIYSKNLADKQHYVKNNIFCNEMLLK